MSPFTRRGVAKSDWLKLCSNGNSNMKTVMIIFKWFCNQHGLSMSGSDFGLTDHPSGYSCLLMVVFFFQINNILPSVSSLQQDENEEIIDGWNFAFNRDHKLVISDGHFTDIDLLMDLFSFYSSFDFMGDIISCFQGGSVSKLSFKNTNLPPWKQWKLKVRHLDI